MTDSNGNDPGTNNETTKQIYGTDIPSKEITVIAKKKVKCPSGGEGKNIL